MPLDELISETTLAAIRWTMAALFVGFVLWAGSLGVVAAWRRWRRPEEKI